MPAAASRGVHGRMGRKAHALRVTRQRGGRSDLACGAVLETIPELCAAQETRSCALRWRKGCCMGSAWRFKKVRVLPSVTHPDLGTGCLIHL
jgi:hypothetical protein